MNLYAIRFDANLTNEYHSGGAILFAANDSASAIIDVLRHVNGGALDPATEGDIASITHVGAAAPYFVPIVFADAGCC